MRYFIAILILILPTLAHAAQTCERGYYKPSPDAECIWCQTGYYCPDDDSDDAMPCPADTTKWNTLLEECGYHPLYEIPQGKLHSWCGSSGDPAYNLQHCFALSEPNNITLQEGLWHMELTYVPERGDYWHGCNTLKYFYAANPGYYLSTYNNTTYRVWYSSIKPCTNAPENAHYIAAGTPDEPVAGGKTDYNDCPWACDDGYGRHNDECLPLCTAGATKFHVGDYVFNIYKDKLTTPAINIQLGNGSVCYVPLVAGSGKGALNVDYKGTVYHTSD